ncbi:MAG: 30S ribosome-binding factor RbfA [Chlamydia sp.]
MVRQRILRLNSLLQEVIAEVLVKDLHHLAQLPNFISITNVSITNDLSFAKVYISVIGDQKIKKDACDLLNKYARQIEYIALRKVVLRRFPELQFRIDEGLEKQIRIQEILDRVQPKKNPVHLEEDSISN